MTTKDCFYLGKVGRPFGYKGEMNIFLDVDDPQKYASLKSVFILTSQGLVPYSISQITITPTRSTIIFAGLSPEEVVLLQGKELHLPLSMLPPLSGNQFYFHELKGCSVIDEKDGVVGVLQEVIDNGPQPVISIISPQNKEILIPLIDEFIVSFDRQSKIFHIKAPEGLIEFYS
ncbi:MAG: ribosome maturation factor RimM [Bacteroidales bacterium]|nr:ribosome maturation factor RimM [Bacteroidales bacterium]